VSDLANELGLLELLYFLNDEVLLFHDESGVTFWKIVVIS
jgi:hypothetical protein